MSKDTKGIHPEPSEDSLMRDLKKENIKLRSLCRKAAEEIRDLDRMIIKSIEDNEVIEYLDIDDAYFAGFSSINLLNRLDGITSGGYVESYDDLNLEMKTLDGHYQAEHPSFYQAAEQVIDDHKETFQKLADNPYPYKHLKEECVAYQEGGMGCPDCYCDSSCKDDSCHICGGNTPERFEEYIPWSCDTCGALCKKSLGPEGYCDTCRPIMLNGGNTPERVEEQLEWVEKIAKQKEEK